MTDYKLGPKSIVDELAQFIRQVDGDHRMGAGALAEKICERFRVDAPAVQEEPPRHPATPSFFEYPSFEESANFDPEPAQQPAPDVKALAEAAAAALGEIEKIMHEAYNSAYPVCCGRPGSECCGSPEPEWSEFDQNTMDRLAPHQRALTATLAPYRKGGEA